MSAVRAEPARREARPTTRPAWGDAVLTIVLLLYLQLHLEVTLESSSLRGVYATRAECEAAATRLRGPLPTPRSYAAAWHDAVCLPINRDVKVNDAAPEGLGRLFERQPPAGECGAAGAWRRLAESCKPSGSLARPREDRSGLLRRAPAITSAPSWLA